MKSCQSVNILQGQINALLPSTVQLQKLLDSSVDVICMINEAGCFSYISAASLQLWGYLPEELIGLSILDFIVKEDLYKTEYAIKSKCRHFLTSHFENRFHKKDGAIVPVIWSCRWDEKERLFYCVARDGSAKGEVEERLEKAQRMARIANFEFDAVNNCYTYTSDTLFEIFGLERERHPVFTTDLFWSLVHPDDMSMVKENLFKSEQLNRATLEYRIIRPDGQVIYINRMREVLRDADGRLLKTIGTIQDITDRKITELAVQQSEKKFKSLVQNGSDMIAIIDKNGNYTYAADSARHLLGYVAEDFNGKNALEFIHPQDMPKVAESLKEAFNKKYVAVKPFRFKNKKGEWRWIETVSSNFLDDPSINGIVVNSRDITEKKNNDDKVRQLSLIAQKTNNAIIITDIDDKIVWVNRAFTRLTEFSVEEVIGKEPKDFLNGPETDPLVFTKIKKAVLNGQSTQAEVINYSKTGKKYWVEIQVQPIYNDEFELVQFLGIARDITERKNAEAQLSLSEQKFKSLVQNGSDLIVIIDQKGILQYVSENCNAILGYTPQYLNGRNAFDFFHSDDIVKVQKEISSIIDNNNTTRGVIHRFLKSNGDWVWLESKGTNHMHNTSIRGILANSRDITDRVELQKKFDQELRNKQKEITAAVIKAQESERSQLGLELHDNVNQVLTTVKLYNEMFLTGYVNDKALLEKATIYIQDCINEIRSISKRLSAPTLGSIHLKDSINELIESINLTNRLNIQYITLHLDDFAVSEDLHLTIYRIVQEALNNIIKYAAATAAIIEIENKPEKLYIRINDNGRGFDIGTKRAGIGITNMKTRAENLNGTFSIESAPGKGCCIEISFPV